jgi:hypothetical protein
MLNLVLPGGYKIKILIFEPANHKTFLDTKIFSSTPNCVGVVFVVFLISGQKTLIFKIRINQLFKIFKIFKIYKIIQIFFYS